MSDLAAEFLRYNTWANGRLLEFCERLEEDILDKAAPGTYGEIRKTLVHMVGSQDRYHFILTGIHIDTDGELLFWKPWPGFATLKRVAADAGAALEALSASAADGWNIRSHYDDKDWRIAGSLLLVQAVTHCSDHRSQVATALTLAGIQPPDLDAWAWGAATGRQLEL
jgi:uncharacterized damage-inducible protein DinB